MRVVSLRHVWIGHIARHDRSLLACMGGFKEAGASNTEAGRFGKDEFLVWTSSRGQYGWTVRSGGYAGILRNLLCRSMFPVATKIESSRNTDRPGQFKSLGIPSRLVHPWLHLPPQAPSPTTASASIPTHLNIHIQPPSLVTHGIGALFASSKQLVVRGALP